MKEVLFRWFPHRLFPKLRQRLRRSYGLMMKDQQQKERSILKSLYAFIFTSAGFGTAIRLETCKAINVCRRFLRRFLHYNTAASHSATGIPGKIISAWSSIHCTVIIVISIWISSQVIFQFFSIRILPFTF